MRQGAVAEIVTVEEEPSQMDASIPTHAAHGFPVSIADALGISLMLLAHE